MAPVSAPIRNNAWSHPNTNWCLVGLPIKLNNSNIKKTKTLAIFGDVFSTFYSYNYFKSLLKQVFRHIDSINTGIQKKNRKYAWKQ